MDFLDPQKKRAYRRRLFLGYGLIGIVLLGIAYILFLATIGLGFDRKTGEIIQNGLVFVDSHPVSSTIYINDQEKGRTDGRFVLQEGAYNIVLKQPGYRDWRRDITVTGDSIERLVYPFLFPVNPVSRDVRVNKVQLDIASGSPDRHWAILHEAGALNDFYVVDTTTKDGVPVVATIPAGVVPAQPNLRLEAVEWSSDNRHLLIKIISDAGVEFMMFDRQVPANTINLTQRFGHSFAQMALRDKGTDQLYGYDTTGVLQLADVEKKTLTVVLDHVLAFWPYADDTILYVSDESSVDTQVQVKILEGDKTYSLRTLPKDGRYLLNMAEFDGHQYVVAGASAQSRVYIYQDPLVALKKNASRVVPVMALLKVDEPASYISFSANTRFIALQGTTKFAVFDAEEMRQFRYDVGQSATTNQKATWMDGHRMSVVSEGKLSIFDFDGTNRQTLVAADQAFAPFFDRDYTALFTISPSSTQQNASALVRTDLLVKDKAP